MTLPISLIVLTYNEEKNLHDCLKSVVGKVNEIFVVDSFSNDKTLEIAKIYGVNIFQHAFENYSKQRNWAFENLPIQNPWIMNLDADHRVSDEFWIDLNHKFEKKNLSLLNGFMAPRRTLFLGKFIKHGGHYPIYQGVVFRKGHGQCEEKEYDQHFVIVGPTEIVKGDIIDILTDSLSTFTLRHDRWSTLEANDALMFKKKHQDKKLVKSNKGGNEMEQRRYMRMKYYSYPLFLRVIIYFIYRYIFKLGFLDGKQGFIFHVLQGFWFRFLVDAKIYEMQKNK